jgi:ribonuclease P protein component
MAKFTLGKHERLKSRKLIEQLFSTGKVFSIPPFSVSFITDTSIFNRDHPTIYVQCGFGVSSRNFKKAVDRNRVKRVCREAWRLQKQELTTSVIAKKTQLVVFLVYTGKELPESTLIKKKMAVIINKLITIVNESTVKDS